MRKQAVMNFNVTGHKICNQSQPIQWDLNPLVKVKYTSVSICFHKHNTMHCKSLVVQSVIGCGKVVE